jgi:type I restriction enzyme, S subunit
VLTGSILPLPPLALQSTFSKTVKPIRHLLTKLLRMNANLRLTRDLLLPKLISGEIDVSTLDIDTSWLAA